MASCQRLLGAKSHDRRSASSARVSVGEEGTMCVSRQSREEKLSPYALRKGIHSLSVHFKTEHLCRISVTMFLRNHARARIWRFQDRRGAVAKSLLAMILVA